MPDAASGDPPQYADVRIEIVNQGEPIPSARLTLIVLRDGVDVESFVLASSLALAEPVTVVAQRYLPATGWVSGTWTFEVVLEAVDPATGAVVPLAEVLIPDPITVPPDSPSD